MAKYKTVNKLAVWRYLETTWFIDSKVCQNLPIKLNMTL